MDCIYLLSKHFRVESIVKLIMHALKVPPGWFPLFLFLFLFLFPFLLLFFEFQIKLVRIYSETVMNLDSGDFELESGK